MFGYCCQPRSKVKTIREFENGTVVTGCGNLQECIESMRDAYTHGSRDYWATMIKYNMYEVQFTPDLHPKVIIYVGAETGQSAAELARLMLKKDIIELVHKQMYLEYK